MSYIYLPAIRGSRSSQKYTSGRSLVAARLSSSPAMSAVVVRMISTLMFGYFSMNLAASASVISKSSQVMKDSVISSVVFISGML